MMRRCHKYTQEEKEFIRGYAYGHSYEEITDEINRKFNSGVSASQIKSYVRTHKIITGRIGVKKGNIPANKGKRMKPETYKKCAATMFKKGNTMATCKPIGTESIRSYRGKKYVYEKVAAPNVWRKKHILEWEKHHGPVPKGKLLIFLDGNTLNTKIENLALIDRSIHMTMNRLGLRQINNKEGTEAAIALAELISAITKVNSR